MTLASMKVVTNDKEEKDEKMSKVRQWSRPAKSGPKIVQLFDWTVACLRVVRFPSPVRKINR